jgi:hypothetical protein
MHSNSLTTNKLERGLEIAYTMAKLFDVDEKDFALISSSESRWTYNKHVMAYAGRLGIDLGSSETADDNRRSWNSIVGNGFIALHHKEFMIELNGQTLDTRLGMTESVYEAMILQVPENHPDRHYEDDRGNIVLPRTWLTGEIPTVDRAPFGIVSKDGKPETWTAIRDRGSASFLFRPAVNL